MNQPMYIEMVEHILFQSQRRNPKLSMIECPQLNLVNYCPNCAHYVAYFNFLCAQDLLMNQKM